MSAENVSRTAATQVAISAYDAGEHVGQTFGRQAGWRECWPVAYAAGREDLAAELDEADRAHFSAVNREIVQHLTSVPSFAELAERRGDLERAARQRELLERNGVVA